jgi:hypothetical protein
MYRQGVQRQQQRVNPYTKKSDNNAAAARKRRKNKIQAKEEQLKENGW